MTKEQPLNELMELNARQLEQVRTVIREEITRTLNALSQAADELDMPYETAELDSRAYQAAREISKRAVASLNVCWTEGCTFTSAWGRPVTACARCGAPEPVPADPFQDHEHVHDIGPDGRATDCIECGAPYRKEG